MKVFTHLWRNLKVEADASLINGTTKGIKYVHILKNLVTKWHISFLVLLYHLLIKLPWVSHCASSISYSTHQ